MIGKVAQVRSPHRPIFMYAIILGLVAGVALSLEPRNISRWSDYQAIRLGMDQKEAVAIVEVGGKSFSGCGLFHYENRDTVCRFEDPWRGYVINFATDSKQVNRKYFFFKRNLHIL